MVDCAVHLRALSAFPKSLMGLALPGGVTVATRLVPPRRYNSLVALPHQFAPATFFFPEIRAMR